MAMMTGSDWRGAVLVSVVVVGLAGCGESTGDELAAPAQCLGVDVTAAGPSGDGDVGDDELEGLLAGPEGWEPVGEGSVDAGRPYFADFLGAETGQWVEASGFAAWSADGQTAPLLLMRAFRFDTAEHAEQVWRRLGTADGWRRHALDGLPCSHGAVTDPERESQIHEAYRLLGRDLAVFALGARSVPLETIDPILVEAVQEHSTRLPPTQATPTPSPPDDTDEKQ